MIFGIYGYSPGGLSNTSGVSAGGGGGAGGSQVLDPYSFADFVTQSTTSADFVYSLVYSATSGRAALLTGISLYADSVGFQSVAFGDYGSYMSNISGTIGVTAAYVGGSYVSLGLSGFGLFYGVTTSVMTSKFGDNQLSLQVRLSNKLWGD